MNNTLIGLINAVIGTFLLINTVLYFTYQADKEKNISTAKLYLIAFLVFCIITLYISAYIMLL